MKILIIGQAPPAVKQTLPYDTTLLYDMLEWAGISKAVAQEIFEFEALIDKFPGFVDGGHRVPSIEEINNHYKNVLADKIKAADKILVLGRVAETYLTHTVSYLDSYPDKRFLFLIHPSRRNYDRIMEQKDYITTQLKSFIYE